MSIIECNVFELAALEDEVWHGKYNKLILFNVFEVIRAGLKKSIYLIILHFFCHQGFTVLLGLQMCSNQDQNSFYLFKVLDRSFSDLVKSVRQKQILFIFLKY